MSYKKIKFCGLTRTDDIQVALSLKVDYIGFVFYAHSPRYVSPKQVGQWISQLKWLHTVAVGLFVNHDSAFIHQAVKLSGVNILQFHGNETPDFCDSLSQQLGLPYWKALHILPNTTVDDLLIQCNQYHNASALLFDTAIPAENIWGGTGKIFEWQHLIDLKQSTQFIAPIILSGGLTQDNIALSIKQVQPWAVDVSSGIEVDSHIIGQSIKGIKDPLKMANFVAAVQDTRI